ncbi:MAG: two-component system, OmpR family, sensor kinase [Thermoleophilaceae bacterium]|jgi:two-component system sensor histidine kinase MprB|nr:two-component system, OmpR family, sensor kinase [Thermoleophilaceae bacterium]
MIRDSLRLRVAVAAAAGVLLAVAALTAAAPLIVSHELRASQDRGLRGRASEIARLSASAPALLTAPGALDAPYGGQDLLVEVLDSRQRIVARSSALGGRLVPVDSLAARAIRDGRTGFGHAELSGAPLRVFVAPLPAGAGRAGGGAVIVASTTGEIERTASRVRHLVVYCALAAVALGALIAAALTRRGLAPLRRLSLAARGIGSSGDAAQRLPAGAGGEVGELTDTLNAMLAALDGAREAERRFLADASHELRNPVTALRGNVEYLARHGADPETVADLRADAERLARLVDDLLALERQAGPASLEATVDLGSLAREAVAAADGGIEAGTIGDVTVRGDEAALRRALGNLLANARVHGRPPVVVSVERAGDRALLSVADAGPGLSQADAAVAFERFWRGGGASARPGSGLGLAIVRATALAHGGDVRVAGAAFTLDLPAADIVRDSSGSMRTVEDVPSTRSVQ